MSRSRKGGWWVLVFLLFGGAGLSGVLGQGNPTLTLGKRQVEPGGLASVTCGNIEKAPRGAWIGFYKADASHRDYVCYTFLNNLTRGYYDVRAPDEEGDYNFRLFLNDGYEPAAVSGNVRVGEPPATAPAAPPPERGEGKPSLQRQEKADGKRDSGDPDRAAGAGTAAGSQFLARFLRGQADANYSEFVRAVVKRFAETGRASERDLLLLLSQPQGFLKIQGQLPEELARQALRMRRALIDRLIAAVGEKPGDIRALIALGSWAESLNAGDMDLIVKGGADAVKRINEMLRAEIARILSQEGDDVCKTAFAAGARFTVEAFEIYVSTLEDFGYEGLKTAYLAALKKAAGGEAAAAAAEFKAIADEVFLRNLQSQTRVSVQSEYYPGASGQDFVRTYFNKPGKSRTWLFGEVGGAAAGRTCGQLEEALLRELGLSIRQQSKVFKFPVIADELVKWGERSTLGIREQAKGLVRAFDAMPDGTLNRLTGPELDLFCLAERIANTDRAEPELIRRFLAEAGMTEEALAQAGEEMLWRLTKESNLEALLRVHEDMARAAAAAGDDAIKKIYVETLQKLWDNEILGGYAKLKPDQLKRLAAEFRGGSMDVLPETVKAYFTQYADLLDLMAEGFEKEAGEAIELARRLIGLGRDQGRITAEEAEEGLRRLKNLKELTKGALPPDLENKIAALRQEIADLASYRQLTGETLEGCLETLHLCAGRGGVRLRSSPELDALVEMVAGLSDADLLRLKFQTGEIAFLREANQVRLSGKSVEVIGKGLRKSAPKNWRFAVKGLVEVAKRPSAQYLAFGGLAAGAMLWYSAGDASPGSGAQDEKCAAEIIYGTFPSFALIVDGLPNAAANSTWLGGGEGVDWKALAEGGAFAGMEAIGLACPVGGVFLLGGYAAYSLLNVMVTAEGERDFVKALYDALDKENHATLNTRDGEGRSFVVTPPALRRNPSTRLVEVVHSAAFTDLYTPRGNVLLDTGEGRSAFDIPVSQALRDFARRNAWTDHPDLQGWADAVRRYFPDLDLNEVESWKLGEVSEQGAEMENRTQFRVGARLVRRYLNARDLLVESSLRHLRARVDDMLDVVDSMSEYEKQLKALEEKLDMKNRILPKAKAELESFWEWCKTAAISSQTRLEQIGGIWKKYLTTYARAISSHEEIDRRYFQAAGLDALPAKELFGLTGEVAEDLARIESMENQYAEIHHKVYTEFASAKGAPPDLKEAFDADAWKRLMSCRVRQADRNSRQARLDGLEADARDILEEIRKHYRDKKENPEKGAGETGDEPPKKTGKITVRVEAAEDEVPLLKPHVGSGAYNMKHYAFGGAFFSIGSAGGMRLAELRADGDWFQKWVCTVPMALEIEGDVKIQEQGFYDTEWGKTYAVMLDPNYKNRIDKITASGFPKQVGPASCELKSHSAGAGDAWGGPILEKYKFKGVAASSVSVSYYWESEVFLASGKELKKAGTGTNSLTFSVLVSVLPKDAKKIKEEKGVKLYPAETTLEDPGTVTFGAIVSGTEPGDAPLTYTWSGVSGFADNGATLDVEKSGTYTISCTVRGAGGGVVGTGTATVKADVDKTVELIRDIPAEGEPVTLGQEARFHAEVKAKGKIVPRGNFIYRWQPNTEVMFNPAEGPSSSVSARFKKPGTIGVWVELLQERGENDKRTLASSQRVNVEILPPRLKLSAAPADAHPGQEVAVTAAFEKPLDAGLASFWWEATGSPLNAGPGEKENIFTFKPRDIQPVTVTCHAKSTEDGSELAVEKLDVRPAPYAVTAKVVERTSPCKVFDPVRKAFVDAPKGAHLCDERIQLEASIDGYAKPDEVRWQWRVNEGASLGNNASRTPSVTRHEPGWIEAEVEARDPEGVLLGRASVSVSVTVSADGKVTVPTPLKATIRPSAPQVGSGGSVSLTVEAAGGTTPYAYAWSIPGAGSYASVSFPGGEAGKREVTVTVRDAQGKTAQARTEVTVSAVPLGVSLAVQPNRVVSGDRVRVSAKASGGTPPYSVEWLPAFASDGTGCVFMAGQVGPVPVRATVTDRFGNTGAARATINVQPANLRLDVVSPASTLLLGDRVELTASASGGMEPYAFTWTPIKGSGPQAVFVADKAGPLPITVAVSDAFGNRGTTNLALVVKPRVLAVRLVAPETRLSVGDRVSIEATASGGKGTYTYAWTPDLGVTGPLGLFTAREAGEPVVSVSVKDRYGNIGATSVIFKVTQPQLVVRKASVEQGGEAAVTLVNPPSGVHTNAWIGFYQAGKPSRDYLNYTFVRNLTDGIYEVTVPETPGQYEFRLFKSKAYDPAVIGDPIEVK